VIPDPVRNRITWLVGDIVALRVMLTLFDVAVAPEMAMAPASIVTSPVLEPATIVCPENCT